jgi:hypothetical protein
MRWIAYSCRLLTALWFAGWNGAQAIDLTDCEGNTVSDAPFNEPIVRDHRDASDGALGNPAVRPLGGGEGYGRIVERPETGVVRTIDELRQALAAPVEGARLIYVDDDAELDLTHCARRPLPEGCFSLRSRPLRCEDYTLSIPPDTVLASGRGRGGSRGALLSTQTYTTCPLISVTGPATRVTGLRIHGADSTIENDDPLHCDGDSSGISVISPTGAVRWDPEIDNNEMAAWPVAAVNVGSVLGVNVHHNVIQFNRRHEHNGTCGRDYGLGYGVHVGPGSAVIEANVFDHNRHDIASSGWPGSFYRATYNLVLSGAVDHSYDVHGGKDRKDCTNVAGSGFVIHHNTFLQAHKPAVRFRGIPIKGAWIYKNTTRSTHIGIAFTQINAQGRFHLEDNRIGINNFPAWFISFGGSSFWQWRRFDGQGMADAAVGDFDGDGVSDVMRRRSSGWQMSKSAREEWTPLNSLNTQVSALRFGDFVGDARTDIIRDAGDHWQVSDGGQAGWARLLTTNKALSDAAFHDFGGDGKTDVFFADGNGWTIIESFEPLVRRHYNEPFKLSELRFGQFTGDGKTDVVRKEGPYWYVWDRGTQAWNYLNTSNFALKDLTFADFNGDGVTDILRVSSGNWYVSWSGTSGWEFLNKSDLNPKNQLVADFNGDGKADVLSRQTPDP